MSRFARPYTRAHVVSSVALAAAFASTGCGHVAYTQGSMRTIGANFDADEFPHDQPLQFDGNEITARTHEVTLLDSTGVVCAAALSATDQAASAEGRRKQAERDREVGVLTYKWRVFQPAELNGFPCGFYVKWSDSVTWRGFGAATAPEVASFGEFGMQLSGWEPTDFLDGLYTGMMTRPAVGFYAPGERFGSDNVYLRLPITFGLLFQPSWLFGLNFRVLAGGDLMSLILTAKGSVFRTWHVPLDYGAFVGYTVPVLDFGSLNATFGYNKEVQVVGDYVFNQGSWQGQLSLSLNYDRIFSGGGSSSSSESRMSRVCTGEPHESFAAADPRRFFALGAR